MASRPKRKAQVNLDSRPAKKTLVEQSDLDNGNESDGDTGSVFSKASDSGSSTAKPTQTAATTPKSSASQTGRKPVRRRTIPCPRPGCEKTFNRPCRLAGHLRSHDNDRPFACTHDGCDKTYIEEKHLKHHIMSAHTQERKYKCQVEGCGWAFVTATKLKVHMDVHQARDRFRCRGYEGCNETFRKRVTLDRHVRSEHLGLPAFACTSEGCDRAYDTAAALRQHVAREHAAPSFWCDDCEERDESGKVIRRVGFTQLFLLEAHARREHVVCAFCPDVKFKYGVSELERHMDIYHSGKTVEERRTHHCTWEGCKASFVRAANLTVHMKSAHQGRSFVCGTIDTSEEEGLEFWNWEEEGCGGAFTTKKNLVSHVIHVHLGKKRPPTMYTAPPKKDLVDELSGVGDRKYKAFCTMPDCGAKFVRYHELNLHVEHDHDGEGGGDVQMDAEDADNQALGGETAGGADTTPLGQETDVAWPYGLGPPQHDSENQDGAHQPFESQWADLQHLIDYEA